MILICYKRGNLWVESSVFGVKREWVEESKGPLSQLVAMENDGVVVGDETHVAGGIIFFDEKYNIALKKSHNIAFKTSFFTKASWFFILPGENQN